ncbi:MAG: acyl--CoA ligase, partial [Oscillospiraceae bacterium]|nr:acyl--CoA ligase [Oscillospiraceae bacterium]
MNYTYNADEFRRVFEKSFTWISGFMCNVRRSPGKTALIDSLTDRSWTYSELNDDVNRFATALAASGVGQGDMVLYQLYNSPQFSLCYIAPQKLGAINSPINFNLSSGETARLIDRDTPKVYVYDCDVMEMAWKALEMCSYKPEVILAVDYRNRRPQLPEGHIFFDDYLAAGTTSEPVTDYIPDMYAEVTRFGTSGTTGMPKGVPINNANEVLSAHTAIMHFPLSPKDVTLNMTPWFHRGGLHCGGMTPTFYVGGTVVILRLFNAKSCFDCVRKYGVTYLIGVPSALKNLAARQEKHPEDLSGLRGIVTMGSPLNKDD